jgi:hypothetical protein
VALPEQCGAGAYEGEERELHEKNDLTDPKVDGCVPALPVSQLMGDHSHDLLLSDALVTA